MPRRPPNMEVWDMIVTNPALLVSEAATFVTGQIERPNGGVAMPW